MPELNPILKQDLSFKVEWDYYVISIVKACSSSDTIELKQGQKLSIRT